MSKTKQSYGMDFDDEASKLLEKALSSFDGIILGKIRLEARRRRVTAQLAPREAVHYKPRLIVFRRLKSTPAELQCFVGRTNPGARSRAVQEQSALATGQRHGRNHQCVVGELYAREYRFA